MLKNNYIDQLIVQLREIIKSYQLNIDDIFKNFDKDKTGFLSLNEFAKLIRIIGP